MCYSYTRREKKSRKKLTSDTFFPIKDNFRMPSVRAYSIIPSAPADQETPPPFISGKVTYINLHPDPKSKAYPPCLIFNPDGEGYEPKKR
jgi:hypothetical protein